VPGSRESISRLARVAPIAHIGRDEPAGLASLTGTDFLRVITPDGLAHSGYKVGTALAVVGRRSPALPKPQ
jgi:hypothetical protein